MRGTDEDRRAMAPPRSIDPVLHRLGLDASKAGGGARERSAVVAARYPPGAETSTRIERRTAFVRVAAGAAPRHDPRP
jgi:hypothetical protein